MVSAGAKRWRQVDGVLLLDKPIGLSSNQALQKARRLFSAAKGGHTGTLDPLASGLLPLCFGEATKFSADLLDADKCYEATLRLGVSTDTYDSEGRVTATRAVAVDDAALQDALAGFRGEISQVPPMYSALKRDGQPLYLLARQGIEVERQARQVRIIDLKVLAFAAETLQFRVNCSKGTYIRSLAHDLGEILGCGAHLTALRRTAVGRLSIELSVSLAQLEALGEADRVRHLLPVDELLQDLPRIDLDDLRAERFRMGNAVAADLPAAERFRVYGPAGLLGVGLPSAGRLQPKRLLGLAGESPGGTNVD